MPLLHITPPLARIAWRNHLYFSRVTFISPNFAARNIDGFDR
jgi:hypothetical protein